MWFKRDLRTADHAPLTHAAARGAVIPLYIAEPSLHHAPDHDPRHWDFIWASLVHLRDELATLGAPLIVRVGEAVPVLMALYAQTGFGAIYAHEETGNAITYARDRAVRRWAAQNGITVDETPSGGVIRPLADRDTWGRIWEKRMSHPPHPTPVTLRPVDGLEPGNIPTRLSQRPATHIAIQPGGSHHAHAILGGFLGWRGRNYHREMSSPVTAFDSCSRLSPHFAYGTISMRQVVHALRARRRELYAMPEKDYRALDGSWKTALRSFNSRLHWRDHFIQKLEDEPEIEWRSFIPAFDDLRPDPATDEQAAICLHAWENGCTGYPMVDAAMRSLRATGYLNFRMRAMVTSFASYDLWLPWQVTGRVLARWFTDYEPGIHWSQMQMQSGTTGINTVRIYNPTKQATDHDPNGVFIRQWVPELQHMPDDSIGSPWQLPPMLQQMYGIIIGEDYPAPIVDHKQASQNARDQIYDLRKDPAVKNAAKTVLQKHGSRRNRRD